MLLISFKLSAQTYQFKQIEVLTKQYKWIVTDKSGTVTITNDSIIIAVPNERRPFAIKQIPSSFSKYDKVYKCGVAVIRVITNQNKYELHIYTDRSFIKYILIKP